MMHSIRFFFLKKKKERKEKKRRKKERKKEEERNGEKVMSGDLFHSRSWCAVENLL
jgi:hypothetical protein